mgnify:CR=1 FL=1
MSLAGKDASLIVGGVVVLTILVVALLQFNALPGSVTGFGTISISPVDIVSNDPTFGGKTILMSVSVNGKGENAVGTLYANTQLRDGSSTADSFTIKTTPTEENCRYTAVRGSETIQQLSYQTKEFLNYLPQDRDTVAGQWCRGLTGGTGDAIGPYYCDGCAAKATYVCPVFSSGSYIGDWAGTGLDFKTNVEFSTGSGKSVSQIVSTDNPSININNVVRGSWIGSLNAANFCPDAALGKPVYTAQSKIWKVIDSNRYAEYRAANNYASIRACFLNSISYGQDLDPLRQRTPAILQALQNCIGGVNGKATAAETSVPYSFRYYSATDMGGTIPSGLIKVSMLDTPSQYPVLQFYVKADWIGIYIPVSQPQASNCRQDPSIADAASVVNLKVDVKAIGADGNYYLRMDPACQIQPAFGANYFYIPKDSTQTLAFPFVSGRGVSQGCSITVVDRNDASKSSITACQINLRDVPLPSAPLPTVPPNPCPSGFVLDNGICRAPITPANTGSSFSIVLAVLGGLALVVLYFLLSGRGGKVKGVRMRK